MGGACGTNGKKERCIQGYGVLVGRPEEKNHLKDLDVDGRIILKLIFKKWNGGIWSGLNWLRIGAGGGIL
jgi:hypothetical protein